MFNGMGENLCNGFVVGPAPENTDFLGNMCSLVLLMIMSGFMSPPISGRDDLKARLEKIHQQMLGTVDDLYDKMDELKKEEASDAL